MAYKRETIIRRIESRIKPLYQERYINYIGATADTIEKYTEVVSEYLVANIKDFKDRICPVTREGVYKVEGHKWHPYNPEETSVLRKEERLARSMFGRKFDQLEILDYQVPLKNVGAKENKGLGKIDLLALDGNNLVILELKKPESNETLLRCILEAFTYWKTVDQEKLAIEFGHKGAQVSAAAIVFENSQPHKDWLDDKQPHVIKLMELLKVDLYVLDNDKDMNITAFIKNY